MNQKGLNDGIRVEYIPNSSVPIVKEFEMYRKLAAICGKILCLVSRVWSLKNNVDKNSLGMYIRHGNI